MNLVKSISVLVTFSKELGTRKLLLIQPIALSPLLMHQHLRSDITSSRLNVWTGYQYSALRYDDFIVLPPLAMHLTFKSHFSPLPSTQPSGLEPWMTRLPGPRSYPSEPWYLKQPELHSF